MNKNAILNSSNLTMLFISKYAINQVYIYNYWFKKKRKSPAVLSATQVAHYFTCKALLCDFKGQILYRFGHGLHHLCFLVAAYSSYHMHITKLLKSSRPTCRLCLTFSLSEGGNLLFVQVRTRYVLLLRVFFFF